MGRKKTPGLVKRQSIWHIDKQIEGRRICASTGTARLAEAEAYLARLTEVSRQARIYGVRPERTFEQAAARFVREYAHKRSIASDIGRLKQLMPWIGDVPIDRLHTGTLQPWGACKQKEGKSAGTINHGLKVVRRILNLAASEWLDEHGLTWLAAAPKIKLLPDLHKRLPYPLTWDEQDALFSALPAHLAEMALFTVNTGCRDQEVCGLRWSWEVAVPSLKTSVFIVPSERVKNGDYWYNIYDVDPEEFKKNYSQAFWAASEANAGKFDVDPETCGIKLKETGKIPEHYYGFPFPNVTKDEPFAACKMAWNFQSANGMGGGQGASFTLNGLDTSGEFKRIKLWLHTLSYLGRPEPIKNSDDLRAATLTNVLEPLDVDGVGGLTKRTNDWTSQDKAWFFVPATRRVRRVNAATRSDPVAGLDIFSDDLNCYGGKIEYYKWELAGEGKILAPVLDTKPIPMKKKTDTRWDVEIPYFKGAYETPGAKGIPWLVVENLKMVPRPVWILHGQSEDPYYNFGKVIMYMDKEMYRIWWKLVHNRAGEYFYNAMCAYQFSQTPDGSFKTSTTRPTARAWRVVTARFSSSRTTPTTTSRCAP